MNRPEIYQKSVDTLLDAYNNRELMYGVCHACAIGNLLGNQGDWATIIGFQGTPTTRVGPEIISKAYPQYKRHVGRKLIEESGYTLEELISIEQAFENQNTDYPTKIMRNSPSNQLKGLAAVLDVLREIHDVDGQTHTHNIERFENVHKRLQLCSLEG